MIEQEERGSRLVKNCHKDSTYFSATTLMNSSNQNGIRAVIEVSGALPLREGETEVGSGQISVDFIKEFLVEDLKLGLETSLKETPRDMLSDTIEKEEWWKGIVLSGALLEHFGSRTLERVTGDKIKNEKISLRLFQFLDSS